MSPQDGQGGVPLADGRLPAPDQYRAATAASVRAAGALRDGRTVATSDGSIIITSREGIDTYHKLALLHAFELEERTGMRMHGGRSVAPVIRKLLWDEQAFSGAVGNRSSRRRLLAEYRKFLIDRGILVADDKEGVMQIHDAAFHEQIERETGAPCPDCVAFETTDDVVIRRTGSAHEEHVRGDRSWCAICGYLDEITWPSDTHLRYHGDSFAQQEEVIFNWSTRYGRCYDCGRPAAFYRGIARTPESQLCAVCAANAAVDGESIHRIEDLELARTLYNQKTTGPKIP